MSIKHNKVLCKRIGYESPRYQKKGDSTCPDCVHCEITEVLQPAHEASYDIGVKTVCREGQFFHLKYKRWCTKHEAITGINGKCNDFQEEV